MYTRDEAQYKQNRWQFDRNKLCSEKKKIDLYSTIISIPRKDIESTKQEQDFFKIER